MDPSTITIAKEAFAEIASRFPSLNMIEDKDTPVELSMTIPAQPGLKQSVWLALQNDDELHFSVANFWLEWFPCTQVDRVRGYIEAVSGYLSGRLRVLEHYRGKRCVKAELQEPANGTWRTIGTWGSAGLPLPWHKTFKIVKNDWNQSTGSNS